ncbi:MAG: hypothetical protein N2036_00385 [Bryobacteraceae bacterium]|nr:hypothetical protein [Bryobacteraceae bacterium]MCX7602508.1 hypothetical protein [Bryobacteraceae bacterium]
MAYPDLPKMTSLRLDQCPVCGSRSLVRRKRSLAERLRHAAVYRCTFCRFEASVPLTVLYPQLSRIARCPRCSSTALRVLARRDPIERLYRGPLSMLWALLGAPILYCPFCRLQFYDFRPRIDGENGGNGRIG